MGGFGWGTVNGVNRIWEPSKPNYCLAVTDTAATSYSNHRREIGGKEQGTHSCRLFTQLAKGTRVFFFFFLGFW